MRWKLCGANHLMLECIRNRPQNMCTPFLLIDNVSLLKSSIRLNRAVFAKWMRLFLKKSFARFYFQFRCYDIYTNVSNIEIEFVYYSHHSNGNDLSILYSGFGDL